MKGESIRLELSGCPPATYKLKRLHKVDERQTAGSPCEWLVGLDSVFPTLSQLSPRWL